MRRKKRTKAERLRGELAELKATLELVRRSERAEVRWRARQARRAAARRASLVPELGVLKDGGAAILEWEFEALVKRRETEREWGQ